jgi:Flp pilus assembly protein TadD
VFVAFAAASALGFYLIQPTGDPPERAVAGSAGTAAPGDQKNSLPGGHPSIELPEEIMAFMTELTAAAEAKPDDVEAWQNLSRARYRAAMLNASFYGSALAALDHLQELDPDNLEAIRTRGNIAYDMRRYDEAEKQFRRYLELDPGDAGVRTDLGTTLLFQDKSEEAKELYRAVIADDPNFGQAHVNLGIALHREGETDEAKQQFARAKELAETDEQRKRLDELIAATEGRTPPGRPSSTPSAAPQVASNASTDFQKEVDGLFASHQIVGPRVRSVNWTGTTNAKVELRDFPMDKMPPVMRNKFKSGINESIAELTDEYGVDAPVHIELVDGASTAVMDSLDGKEWVGAFDEAQYE